MNEYAPQYIYPVLAAIAAGIGWYCYRWGHSDGFAEGHVQGEIGKAVSPQGGGGPGLPEK